MRAWGSRSRSSEHVPRTKRDSSPYVKKAAPRPKRDSSPYVKKAASIESGSSSDIEEKKSPSTSPSRSVSTESSKLRKTNHSRQRDGSRKKRQTRRKASRSPSSTARTKTKSRRNRSRSLLPPRWDPDPRHVFCSPREVGLIGRRSHQKADFSIVYWGGVGIRGWDFNQQSNMPRICQHCDDLVDSWRGRLENAQLTLRICAAEGGGFKDFVKRFVMLSSGDVVDICLPTFYRWCIKEKKKVLTERIVIGTMLSVNAGQILPRDCGIDVVNRGHGRYAWEAVLRRLAVQMRQESRRSHGHFACVLLDGNGVELRVAEMINRVGSLPIKHLLVILGGPDGIHDEQKARLHSLLKEHSDLPLLSCSLPGGKMHSYYALATFFAMHDQELLLPFLSHMAEHS